jgi:ATP-dependent Clp protease ATP-binding subunit ClpA
LGKEGDFSNAIIIFTSNIGADTIVKEFEKGNIPQVQRADGDSCRSTSRPEFLARIRPEMPIPFAPVNENTTIHRFF